MSTQLLAIQEDPGRVGGGGEAEESPPGFLLLDVEQPPVPDGALVVEQSRILVGLDDLFRWPHAKSGR